MARVSAFLLVLLLALELAVWESFLVAARPFGSTLPLAAALAVVGNLAVGVGGARVLRRPLGAAAPGLVWLVVAVVLGTKTAEGDVVVTNTFRGMAFLLAGTAAAFVAVGLSLDPRGRRASPRGETRR